MIANDPTLEAVRSVFGTSLDSLRTVIVGASADVLNFRPAGEATNSIAVLAVHALSSGRWWLSLAVGAPIPERDRASEFLTDVGGADELLATFDPLAADCRALLDSGTTFDPAAIRHDTSHDEQVTAAWALIHATEHLREHVAHAELTRQVFDRRV